MSYPLPKRLQSTLGTKERAPFQEAALAKKFGGKVTAGSGNKDEKGDVRKRGFVRIECKNTDKERFTVTQEMVRKIENAAMTAGEIPIMQIDLGVVNGDPSCSFCVVPNYIIDILAEKINNP